MIPRKKQTDSSDEEYNLNTPEDVKESLNDSEDEKFNKEKSKKILKKEKSLEKIPVVATLSTTPILPKRGPGRQKKIIPSTIEPPLTPSTSQITISSSLPPIPLSSYLSASKPILQHLEANNTLLITPDVLAPATPTLISSSGSADSTTPRSAKFGKKAWLMEYQEQSLKESASNLSITSSD